MDEPIDHHLSTWEQLKRFIYKVHYHVCGHDEFGDMKHLLKRNDLWTGDDETYIKTVVGQFNACRAELKPIPSRKVSIASLSRKYNDAVCINHLFLDEIRVFQINISSN